MQVARPRRLIAVGAALAAVLCAGPLATSASAVPAIARQAATANAQVIADVLGWFPSGSGFVPVSQRLLDTRTVGSKVGQASTVDVAVAGVAGVPTTGVGAAVLNVTVTEPTAGGFLTAYPSGTTRPGTSNLNYNAGATVANLVVSALGTNGAVSLYVQQPAHVVVDLVGYLPADSFVPVGPARVLDTRGGSLVAANSTVQAPLGLPDGATAVVNLTSTESAGTGFLRAWAAEGAQPTTSNVNYAPGYTVANLALVPVGASGTLNVLAAAGATHVIVDVLGYVPAGKVQMVAPTRVLDTRDGTGGVTGPVANDGTFDIPIAGKAGVPAMADTVGGTPGSAIVNLTVAQPNGSGFVAAFRSGSSWPGTSNVNFAVNQTAANLAIVELGANGAATALTRVVPPPPNAGPPAPEGLPFAPSKRGDSGPQVQALQTYLTFSSFWLGEPGGSYGQLTQQAVMAFQKYVGLPASGAADAATIAALVQFHDSGQWPQARSTGGNLVEVDKTKQLLFIIRDGRVLLTINTSTGTERTFTEFSEQLQKMITDVAHTYEGVLRVYRQVSDGWVKGELGQIYRPKYVKGGVAIHGSPSIPNYPASHGCIRVSTAFMDTVWAYDLIPFGSTVWVYR